MGFKHLKQQAAKKKGKGAGANPENEHFKAAIKGISSAVVDFDFFNFEDGATLFVIGEEESSVRACLIEKDFEKEQDFKSVNGKVQAGEKVISVSVGPLRVTDS